MSASAAWVACQTNGSCSSLRNACSILIIVDLTHSQIFGARAKSRDGDWKEKAIFESIFACAIWRDIARDSLLCDASVSAKIYFRVGFCPTANLLEFLDI